MSTRTVRVTVRGAFDGLTAEQRADLLVAASEHDFLHTRYTAEGHLTYDVAARSHFVFRFLTSAEDEADIEVAVAVAEAAAQEWLTGRGYGYKNLTARAVDMSQVPLGARGRRAAARS